MARYKNKKPINILTKETREKYLSMTYQGLLMEEKNLKSKKSRLEHETSHEAWDRANNYFKESRIVADSIWNELQKKVEKDLPPAKNNLFNFFLRNKKEEEIQSKMQVLWEKGVENKNSRVYKEWVVPLNKQDKMREDLLDKEKQIRTIEMVQKAMPEIKRRVKNKEKSAKLGAYEETSRVQGEGIIKKIKEQTSYPFNCPYCMNLTDRGSDHVDHINPISNGGLSVENNMVLVCSKCNLKKRDLSLRIFCKSNNLDFNELSERLEKMGKWI